MKYFICIFLLFTLTYSAEIKVCGWVTQSPRMVELEANEITSNSNDVVFANIVNNIDSYSARIKFNQPINNDMATIADFCIEVSDNSFSFKFGNITHSIVI
jgi:hypothetical protein